MIHIISRHCKFSKTSANKQRPDWFSKAACFNNLTTTGWSQHPGTELDVYFDGTEEELKDSYLRNDVPWFGEITCLPFYSEAKGFIYLIEHACRNYDDDDIVYFCEDDYLHRDGWLKALEEGFTIHGVEMVTLYDHADKYDKNMYPNLKSEVYVTDSCHWRTVPSTCHTFGVKVRCIKDLRHIWLKYSEGDGTSIDHEKFVELQQNGAKLVSSMPGFSTHVQPPWLSPGLLWENISTACEPGPWSG